MIVALPGLFSYLFVACVDSDQTAWITGIIPFSDLGCFPVSFVSA